MKIKPTLLVALSPVPSLVYAEDEVLGSAAIPTPSVLVPPLVEGYGDLFEGDVYRPYLKWPQ